jgi:hypothetical protein
MKHIIVKRLGKIWNICNKRRIKKLEIGRNQEDFCREIDTKISTQNLTGAAKLGPPELTRMSLSPRSV